MICGRVTGLRAVESTDLAPLLAWRNRPDFRRYFREFRELNTTMQQKWFDQSVNGDPSIRMFAIEELGSSRLLGACGLCYIDWVNRSADFSIYIGADNLYIDDQLAPDAAQTLITYGFDELCLNRIWSEIYEFDNAKRSLFDRLGFNLDGRHRRTHWTEGSWHDSLVYSLLVTDPQPLRA